MIIQIIRLKSNLPEAELLKKAKERAPQFEKISGLLQKYYVKIDANEYGGIYVWDSQGALDDYRQSELAAGIPQAYEIIEAPDIEMLDVLFQLRDNH